MARRAYTFLNIISYCCSIEICALVYALKEQLHGKMILLGEKMGLCAALPSFIVRYYGAIIIQSGYFPRPGTNFPIKFSGRLKKAIFFPL